ncbi:YjdF family protein [Flintibacter porci]|uniref:YjdF family protein n=1 Tax=Flintibacter porci TaxID=3342383 RepID=UPI003F8B9A08
MERNISQFTVLFQPPFWVGIAERWSQDGYQAARVVFGAEPTDAQLYQWLQREWPRLPFGPVLPETAPRPALANPKRMQREAAKATQPKGLGTKAQEALARQREAVGLERQARRAAQKRQTQEERFRLRQEKKREKRRGHKARAALFYKIRLHRPAPEQTPQRWPAEPERTARNQH